MEPQISRDQYQPTAYTKQPPYSVLDTTGSRQLSQMPGKTASPNPIENRKYLLIAKQGKRAIPKYMYILRSIYHCQGRTAIPNSVMKDDQDKTAIPIPNLSTSIPASISQSKARP